jgi:membrane-bound lytic murein transglycosylase D
MNRILSGITLLCLAGLLSGQGNPAPETNSIEPVPVPTALQTGSTYLNGNGYDESGNRLPQLLRDVKVLLAEAMIADVHRDTLEVIYTLDRIFELLTEADQLGEMTAEDQEEFSRFETSLIDMYTHRLNTLEATEVPFTADQIRHEIMEFTEPLEMEMGRSKFVVVDDRAGHIPLVRNRQVDQFIQYFKTKGRRQFTIWLKRYAVYGDLLKAILREHGLPEELVFLAMIESGLNPKAYSRASAVGMWQFVYATGKKYGLQRNWYIDERRDPVKSTEAACAYLKDLYTQFDNWYLALAAYNGGSGRITRAIHLHQTEDFWQLHSLPKETRNFVPYFLAVAIIGRNPSQYGFTLPQVTSFTYDEVFLEKSADLAVLARSAEISLKTLREYNPELRQSATPAEGGYTLKLPPGKKDIFLANFSALPEDQRFAPQYIVHRVRRGESLWSISKKYKVSIHDLAAVNKIRNRHKIQVGQKLTIPIRGSVYAGGSPELDGLVKVVYTVKRGDTLSHIAENYKTRASKIRRWNNLKYGDYIYPGQKLVLWVKQG